MLQIERHHENQSQLGQGSVDGCPLSLETSQGWPCPRRKLIHWFGVVEKIRA